MATRGADSEKDDKASLPAEFGLLVKRGWRDLSRRPEKYPCFTSRLENYFKELPPVDSDLYRRFVYHFLSKAIDGVRDDLLVRQALRELLGLRHNHEDVFHEDRRRLANDVLNGIDGDANKRRVRAFEASGPREDGQPSARVIDGRSVQRNYEPGWSRKFIESITTLPALSYADSFTVRRWEEEFLRREAGQERAQQASEARPPPLRTAALLTQVFDVDYAAEKLEGVWTALAAQQFSGAAADLRGVLYHIQLPRYPHDSEIEIRAKAHLLAGHLYRDSGPLSAAAWHYDMALAMYSAVGKVVSVAHARLMSAVVLEMGARVEGAKLAEATDAYRRMYQQLEDLSRSNLVLRNPERRRDADLFRLRAQTFLASTLSKQRQFDAAIPLLLVAQRALAGDHGTDYVTTACKLGSALTGAGKLDEAFTVFENLRVSGHLLQSSKLHRARVDLATASLYYRAGDSSAGDDSLRVAKLAIKAGGFGHLLRSVHLLETGQSLVSG